MYEINYTAEKDIHQFSARQALLSKTHISPRGCPQYNQLYHAHCTTSLSASMMEKREKNKQQNSLGCTMHMVHLVVKLKLPSTIHLLPLICSNCDYESTTPPFLPLPQPGHHLYPHPHKQAPQQPLMNKVQTKYRCDLKQEKR